MFTLLKKQLTIGLYLTESAVSPDANYAYGLVIHDLSNFVEFMTCY